MQDGSDRRVEIGVCALIIAICAAILWETRDIPPGAFEPLGSAPVPQVTAGIVIFLCLLVIGQGLRREHADRMEDSSGIRPRWLDATAVLGMSALYVAALHLRLTTFAIMTTIFLTLAIGLLLRFRLRDMPIVLLVAAVTGFGCQYVFTRIFIVDLPGL
jgi:hypothetical protein